MTVHTWNKLVRGFTFLQTVGCLAVVILSHIPNAQAAAMTWMVIGCPCMFGFLIPEGE